MNDHELAAEGIPVVVRCPVLKLARQSYYRWLACPATDPQWLEAHRANALFDAHRDNPGFGYRFLAERPNQLWSIDILEHATREGKVYLCAVKDVFSGQIVGYSISSRMKARLAVAALDNAVIRYRIKAKPVAGCVLHSDRGSRFRSRKHQHAINPHAMVGSMGGVGAAGDNAARELLFGLLQNNVLTRCQWNIREGLTIVIVTWTGRTYHRRRHQQRLERSNPVEFEMIMKTTAPQAA